MGWVWCLRTVVSTGLLFISGWFAIWTTAWWYWLRLTPNLSTRALWQPPGPSGGPAIRDISGASGEVDDGNESLVYLSPWDLRDILNAVKSYDLWPPALLPNRRKLCCGSLSPWKSIALAGLGSANFGSSCKHTATNLYVVIILFIITLFYLFCNHYLIYSLRS
jgi:hypothetical protein